MTRLASARVENTVDKGENAKYQHCLLCNTASVSSLQLFLGYDN